MSHALPFASRSLIPSVRTGFSVFSRAMSSAPVETSKNKPTLGDLNMVTSGAFPKFSAVVGDGELAGKIVSTVGHTGTNTTLIFPQELEPQNILTQQENAGGLGVIINIAPFQSTDPSAIGKVTWPSTLTEDVFRVAEEATVENKGPLRVVTVLHRSDPNYNQIRSKTDSFNYRNSAYGHDGHHAITVEAPDIFDPQVGNQEGLLNVHATSVIRSGIPYAFHTPPLYSKPENTFPAISMSAFSQFISTLGTTPLDLNKTGTHFILPSVSLSVKDVVNNASTLVNFEASLHHKNMVDCTDQETKPQTQSEPGHSPLFDTAMFGNVMSSLTKENVLEESNQAFKDNNLVNPTYDKRKEGQKYTVGNQS
jgi:hypothetical protein